MLTAQSRFPLGAILSHGFLPSPLKLLYRLRGYRIGKGVSIGFGSVICSDDVEIGEHTKIGFFSFIRGKKTRVGAHVNIGSGTMIDTPILEIGDGTKINEQVFVGGLQFPDSTLKVGKNCQIMQMTFINPTRSIVIGDDSGIGGDCLLFGHASWLSKFEGYPVHFQSIEIGNSVSLAWRVFVLPGAKIGDGTLIGANSLVNRTIPPRCLAVGSPAKVVGKGPYFPRHVSDEEKQVFLDEIVEEMVEFLQGHGMRCRKLGSLIEVTVEKRKLWRRSLRTWRLRVETGPVTSSLPQTLQGQPDVVLSLRRIPREVRIGLGERRVVWIDVESKERADFGNDLGEEVVQYLRRYGVRFTRSD